MNKEVGQALFRAADIPRRFCERGDLRQETLHLLEEEIDQICATVLVELYSLFTAENLVNCFLDTVYEQVEQLLEGKYRLQLTSLDKAAFKSV